MFLLVHGFAASWRWWLRILPAMSGRHRVIAVDLPGFGDSETIAALSTATVADRLDGLCAELGLGAVTVVGHSLGTVIACELAVRCPERVRALVLVGGPIRSVLELFHHPVRTLRRHPQVASFLLEAAAGPLPLPAPVRRAVAASRTARRLAMAPYLADPGALPPDLAEHLMRGAGAPAALPTLLAGLRENPTTHHRDIDRPTLVIGGADDMIVPVADLTEHARSNRVDELLLLDGTGHSPMIERPLEVVRAVRRFLG